MYKCKYCNKEFSRSTDLANHVKSVHIKKEVYSYTDCPICGKNISTNPCSYNKHILYCSGKRKPYICKTCGILVNSDSYYGSGVFCSRKCSNSRKPNIDTIKKISESLKKFNKNNLSKIKKQKSVKELNYELNPKLCKVCGEPITYKKRDNVTCGNHECKYKNCGGLRDGTTKHSGKSGFYKGIWCDSTYELVFVVFCIDHNINFKRNKNGFKYIYDNVEHKFYPDFIINNNFYVEIKGIKSDINDYKKNAVPHPIRFLYREDLKNCFDYVKNTYGYNMYNLEKLYDKRNI